MGVGRRLTFSQRAALCAAAAAVLVAPIAIGALTASVALAQLPAAPLPKFAVASIKRCKAGEGQRMGGVDSSPGRLSTGCTPLAGEDNTGLIQRAYVRFAGGHRNPMGVVPIKGAPNWIHSEMFRIEARADGHASNEMMEGPMMQALLEERFHLRIRRETQEGPVYALTLANAKARLKAFQEGSCVQMPIGPPLPPPPPGQRYCKALVATLNPSVVAEGSTVTEFSKLLNLILDRPVVDRTGIEGRFDLHLEFARDENLRGLPPPPPDAPAAAASDPSKPTIFTAIQEQLGLKLTPARGPIEFLMIDHIERPTEN